MSGEWKDISTAPEDGTRVLLGRFVDKCPHGRNGFVSIDWYRRASDGKGYIGWGAFNMQHWPATHWQPIPAPSNPNQKETDNG